MATATPTQMSMQTPTDLFVHELSDTYSAEQIIVQMLGEAQGLVQDQQLAEGLRMHLQQSQQHVQRLELASYNGLITKAQAMGQSGIVELLQQNLQEEQQTLEQVEMIGQRFAE